MQLPDWASQNEAGDIIIDADTAYPALLAELEPHFKAKGIAETDQYCIETVYQFAKLDVRRALVLGGESAWPARILIQGDKTRWALKQWPVGRGGEKATQGREARHLYQKVRGFVPN